MRPASATLDADELSVIRRWTAGKSGAEYWRSLGELAQTDEFRAFLHREFPAKAPEWSDELSRRDFLRLMAASFALAGLTSCTRQPLEKIVPYVNRPEQLVPGQPLYFATADARRGFASGLLVESHEGHPTKAEGNDRHPESLGATNIFGQAALLDLYDPDRSDTITHRGTDTWSNLLTALREQVPSSAESAGAGLRILTETVTSPTLASQIQDLLARFPEARWYQYEPLFRDNAKQGALQAFGRVVEARHAFDQADVIVALDSDFLFAHPAHLRYTRDFTDRRRVRPDRPDLNRLYTLESTPTLTGSMADHRLPLNPSEIQPVARAIAARLGLPVENGNHPIVSRCSDWIDAVAADLEAHRGQSVVVVGDHQPPAVHLLAHWINDTLGNVGRTVEYAPSAEAQPVLQLEQLQQLTDEMGAGTVRTLLILGGNPAFDAPVDLGFPERLEKVPFTLHLGIDANETSRLCDWHVPQTHFLESWSDARAFDGTASILQPLIQPLYNGRSPHELLDALQSLPERRSYDIVRDYWRRTSLAGDFEANWETALREGVVGETRLSVENPPLRPDSLPAEQESGEEALEIVFRPDPSIWDGRYANNGWLQELPKPFTKLTWDNAILVSPALAEQYALANQDVIEVESDGRRLQGPVWILPGQASRTMTLPLGYGREAVGRVGQGTGFNAYALRTSRAPWTATGATLKKTGRRHPLASTQEHHSMDGRHLFRSGTLEEFRDQPDFAVHEEKRPERHETLYRPDEHTSRGYQWAMAIDLSRCIGCNACVLACQSENNIPVVGKKQVAMGREMHWIRIDAYYQGPVDRPEMHHQPVPCMHCENAPCEPVCPVAATLHDREGLNLQIYNRCIGTRYCSNNCPYKVRRFNFLQYVDYTARHPAPMRNPDVTVRWRGVMEKCTYCVQRISTARIEAKKQGREIADGEVQTACQQVCPAQAIMFGDVSDPAAEVSQWKGHPLNYGMLEELNTRPRTTYLAKVKNPNPRLERAGSNTPQAP